MSDGNEDLDGLEGEGIIPGSILPIDCTADIEEAAHRLMLMHNLSSVAIVATFVAPDGRTQQTHTTLGNWYATMGAMREWMAGEDERIRLFIRQDGA